MAEKNELMTIKAFAEASGRSQQTIYKQIGTRLAPYLHEIEGKKYIERSALFEVFHIGEEVEQCNFNSTKPSKSQSDKALELLEKTIEMLERQLDAKDREIERLTEAIQSQARGINGAQALHAETMQQLGAGEPEPQDEVVVDAEPVDPQPAPVVPEQEEAEIDLDPAVCVPPKGGFWRRCKAAWEVLKGERP